MTGEIHGIGYRTDQEPSCTLYVIGPDGRLRSSTDIGLLAPRSVHDVAVTTDHVVVWEGGISSLRRFKDDAAEVRQGFDCGIGLEHFQDIKLGDIIEAYKLVEVTPEL